MAEHTPGPWFARHGCMIDASEDTVAEAWLGNSVAERRANAHLIAAAPDMLEALEDLTRYVDAYLDADQGSDEQSDLFDWVAHSMDTADAAIAKAKGDADAD